VKSWNEVLKKVCEKKRELMEKKWKKVQEEAKGRNFKNEDLKEIWDEYFANFYKEYENIKSKLAQINQDKEVLVVDGADEEIFKNWIESVFWSAWSLAVRGE